MCGNAGADETHSPGLKLQATPGEMRMLDGTVPAKMPRPGSTERGKCGGYARAREDHSFQVSSLVSQADNRNRRLASEVITARIAGQPGDASFAGAPDMTKAMLSSAFPGQPGILELRLGELNIGAENNLAASASLAGRNPFIDIPSQAAQETGHGCVRPELQGTVNLGVCIRDQPINAVLGQKLDHNTENLFGTRGHGLHCIRAGHKRL